MKHNILHFCAKKNNNNNKHNNNNNDNSNKNNNNNNNNSSSSSNNNNTDNKCRKENMSRLKSSEVAACHFGYIYIYRERER